MIDVRTHELFARLKTVRYTLQDGSTERFPFTKVILCEDGPVFMVHPTNVDSFLEEIGKRNLNAERIDPSTLAKF